MSGRPQRRSIRPGSPQTPIRRRWAHVSGRRDGTTKPAKDAADESAPKISALEAELLGLRQLLAKIRAKMRGSAAGNGRFAPRPRPLAKSGEVGRS
jgi:hypothetical protein